jgi:hypothetical protein
MPRIYLAMPTDGGTETLPAIEYKEDVWIVPTWFENNALGQRKPERIIRLKDFPFQRFPPGHAAGDFAVNVGIPKTVLYGPDLPPEDSLYEVEFRPDILFPLPPTKH